MTEPHVCIDPVGEESGLRRVHEVAFAEGGVHAREAIGVSWRRSLAAGVDPEVEAAPEVYEPGRLLDARAGHVLERHLPMLRSTLRPMLDEAVHLLFVTDGEGHVLWSDGPASVRRKADLVGLSDGFCWSEASVGTNGIGTALAEGKATYVYSAEHLARVLHGWSCAAAPVTDPDTGKVVGCVDVSATIANLHPATVALVSAAARLTEAQMALDMHAQDDLLRSRHRRHLQFGGALVTPTGRLLVDDGTVRTSARLHVPALGGSFRMPDGRMATAEALGEAFLVRVSAPERDRPLLSLRVLGDRPSMRLNGRQIPLSPRRAEVLVLLALSPLGLNADQLSYRLYGETGNPVTLRAEIHRLRAVLGDIIQTRPYRLACDLDVDLLTVAALLADGRVDAAARVYRGPLLPHSDSPAIWEEREQLAAQLRNRLLERGGPDALWSFAETDSGRDDTTVLTRLVALLHPGDPRLVTVRLRLARLTA